MKCTWLALAQGPIGCLARKANKNSGRIIFRTSARCHPDGWDQDVTGRNVYV